MKVNVKIYQLKTIETSYAFRDYDVRKFNLKDYKLVYETERENSNHLLDELFAEFNCNHPADFRGHSLSVSDIVELNGIKYYCECYGWREI